MCRRTLVMVLLALPHCCVAATPVTRPAGTAALAPDGRQLRLWVAGLMDPDASERQRSREALLNLKRSDLPALRAAVGDFKSLDERTVDELRDVVGHVFLTGEPYDKEEAGFLGVTMSLSEFAGEPGAAQRPEIVIDARMPGFEGYRALQDGDAVLDIEEASLPQPARRLHFIETIKGFKPGQKLTLKVLRQGQVLRVPVTLSPRPAERSDEIEMAYEARVKALRDRRDQTAGEYWRREFAPLVETAGNRNAEPARARAVN
jgi:hypothetical protein